MRQLDKTNNFIEKLKKIFPREQVIGIDERFSSFDARYESDAKHIDDVAASLILDNYLKTL